MTDEHGAIYGCECNTCVAKRSGQDKLYNRLIGWFSTFMLFNLRANNSKGDCTNIKSEYLYDKAQQHMEYLLILIEQEKSSNEITHECADIANYLMMLAQSYKNRRL